MAFTGNFSCDVFRTGLMNGTYNFSTDTFYLALYTNEATLGPTTTSYTSTGEVVDAGYTAGGQQVFVNQVPTTGNPPNTTAYISFSNVSWSGAITARGALIYKNDGVDNPAVCVLDFGSNKTSTDTFVVQFPAATDTTAIIRIV